jgi:hypothetical protein
MQFSCSKVLLKMTLPPMVTRLVAAVLVRALAGVIVADAAGADVVLGVQAATAHRAAVLLASTATRCRTNLADLSWGVDARHSRRQ